MSRIYENMFTLSPEHKGGIRQDQELKHYAVDDFHIQTPSRLKDIAAEEALFVPRLPNTEAQLFWILQASKSKEILQAYGDMRIVPQKDAKLFALSLPQSKEGAKYLYYTALHALLQDHDKKHPILEAEKKVYNRAEHLQEDHKPFVKARMKFFEGLHDAHGGPVNHYKQDILDTLNFLINHQ